MFRTLFTVAGLGSLLGLAAPAQTPTKPIPTPLADAELVQDEAVWLKAYQVSDYPNSIAISLTGLARARQLGSPSAEALFLRHLAYDNWLMGNLDLAIDYSQRLLDLAGRTHADADASRAHRYLSEIFESLGDEPHAHEHALEALRLAQTATDPTLRIFAIESLGHWERRTGDFAAARRHIETVRAYWAAAGSRWNAANSTRDLAEISEAQGDLAAALVTLRDARREMEAVGDRRGRARADYGIASLLRRQGRTDEALAQLELARPVVAAIGGHQILSEFAAELALTLEARGDLAGALAAERRAAAEREALVGDRAQVRVADLGARLDLAKKQQAIDELARTESIQAAVLRQQDAELRARTAELARSRTLRWAVVGFAVLGVGALGAVVFAQRARLRAEHRVHTETRSAKERAEEADRLKTRFLGIASHDIRGPVGNILNLAEGLRAAATSSPEARRDLDLMVGECERVLALLEDLLTHSALESRQLKLQATPIDLVTVVRAVMASVGWRAAAKHQTLALRDSAPGAGQITGDADRLYQVAANLIGNAIKFTPAGKSVAVAVTRTGSTVTLAVRDEGPGMSADVQARLFAPFTRLSARATGGEFSHGLGLSIAYEIVRLHAGRIRVESIPGGGTTFSVDLPAGGPA